MGGAKRANTYAKLLGTPIIISHKERAKANVVGKMTAIGEVEGRNILIVDDMIDTAGTICMAADMLMSRGAKSVRAAITHPVLSGPAYERINDSALEEVIVTDTIPLNPDKDLHKFTVLTIADMFADVIERVHNYKEIFVYILQIGIPRKTNRFGRDAWRRRFGRRTAAEIRPATPKRRFGVNAFRSRNAFRKPYRAGRITNAFRFFQPEEGGFGNSYYICAEAETPPRNERKPIKQ